MESHLSKPRLRNGEYIRPGEGMNFVGLARRKIALITFWVVRRRGGRFPYVRSVREIEAGERGKKGDTISEEVPPSLPKTRAGNAYRKRPTLCAAREREVPITCLPMTSPRPTERASKGIMELRSHLFRPTLQSPFGLISQSQEEAARLNFFAGLCKFELYSL